MSWSSSFEGTLHIKDADLQKMAKLLGDVNIKECPYFDLSDKYGNSARYYRENQWIPCSERLPGLDESVLVTDGDTIQIAYLRDCLSFATDDIYEWVDNYDYLHDFDEWDAWMPLPEPYKGDEE